jgi:DNA replication protein DnaC
MIAKYRRALAEVRFDWAPQPDDVWSTSPFHVDGLHASTVDEILRAVAAAKESPAASPLGVAVVGTHGAGKTHLLGTVREKVQADGAYFFLVNMADGATFWENAVLCLLNGLGRPAAGGGTQLSSFLHRLAASAGVPTALQRTIGGTRRLTPEDLNQFLTEVRRLDRQVGQECRETARALVLYACDDPNLADIGWDYLTSMNELGSGTGTDERSRWGIQPGARSARRILGEISQLLALTGPTVIAIDQFDTLVATSVSSALANSAGGAGSSGNAGYGGEPGGDSAGVEPLADALMALREVTRRTVCLLSCLPASWAAVRQYAPEAVLDRFRPLAPLKWVGDPAVAESIVARRLTHYYQRVGFHPPHPTWPIRGEAFADAVDLTPRRLLQLVDGHIRTCLDRDDPDRDDVEEFAHLTPSGYRPPTAGADDVADLDARFAELCDAAAGMTTGAGQAAGSGPATRSGATARTGRAGGRAAGRSEPTTAAAPLAAEITGVGITGALHHDTEDQVMPDLLAAGLACWIEEQGEQAREFSFDGPPGVNPPLHARLRRTLDETTGEEAQWAFRAISHASALGALNRLRAANIAAGVGTPRRRLFILREGGWSTGDKTRLALAALRDSGGETLTVEMSDLYTFAALRQLRAEAHPALSAWLGLRRPASQTRLFTATLGGALNATVATPFTYPQPESGDEVAAVAAAAIESHHTYDNPVPLGVSLVSGATLDVELEALRRHTVIFAGSGSGKTVLIRRLVEECALYGVSSIVLDPNNDLARLGDRWPEEPDGWAEGDHSKVNRYLDSTDVVVWTPRRDSGRPLSFQPLPDFTSVLDDADEFRAAIDSAVAALAPRAKVAGNTKRELLGQAVLREALQNYARHGGTDLRGFVGVLGALPDGVSQLERAEKIAGEMAQLLTAAMVVDPLFGGHGTPVDPGELLRPANGKRARVSVISLVGLPSDEQRQGFVNQLQMALFAWVKRNPSGDRPLGGLFVMDEAQNLAPSGAMTPCTQSTIALVSQARKYGLGLVFATQAPRGLHNRISGNAATQFFGLLNAPAQIDAAREMARAKGGDVPDIARLGRGQFYAAADGGPLIKIQAPNCLTHHPKSPLTTEEVIERAARSALYEEVGTVGVPA